MRRWKKGLSLVCLSANTVSRKPPPPITPPVLLRPPSPSFRSLPDNDHPSPSLRFASYSYSSSSSSSSSSLLAATETLKSPSKCWNCESSPSFSRTSPFLVCDSCLSVQPVDDSVNYFQIFGLEKRYEIDDLEALEGKYKEWQKKLHPDLVHSKSQRERDYAAEQSARVIDAYHTLSKPLSRATYILQLEGVNINEEETVTEPELLSEIMEIREAVEEAADSPALMHIHSQMEVNIKHWSKMFGDSLRDQKFEDCQDCIRRMKYYSRVSEEIVKKL